MTQDITDDEFERIARRGRRPDFGSLDMPIRPETHPEQPRPVSRRPAARTITDAELDALATRKRRF